MKPPPPEHNHPLKPFGALADHCPACDFLRANPYVLEYFVTGRRGRQRARVASVTAAREFALAVPNLKAGSLCSVMRGRECVAFFTVR